MKLIETLREKYRKSKKNDIIEAVKRNIYITDREVEGSQVIALVVEGVTIDYFNYDAKTADVQRIIGKLLTLRTNELDRQLKKEGLTL